MLTCSGFCIIWCPCLKQFSLSLNPSLPTNKTFNFYSSFISQFKHFLRKSHDNSLILILITSIFIIYFPETFQETISKAYHCVLFTWNVISLNTEWRNKLTSWPLYLENKKFNINFIITKVFGADNLHHSNAQFNQYLLNEWATFCGFN